MNKRHYIVLLAVILNTMQLIGDLISSTEGERSAFISRSSSSNSLFELTLTNYQLYHDRECRVIESFLHFQPTYFHSHTRFHLDRFVFHAKNDGGYFTFYGNFSKWLLGV